MQNVTDDDIEIEAPNTNQPNKTYAETVNMDTEYYRCQKCDYKTKVKVHVRGHMIAHHGQYQCMRGCSKVAFTTLGGLDDHIKTQHGQQQQQTKGCTCIHCDITFNAQFQLRQHMTQRHGNESQPVEHNCQLCGMNFATIELINEHQQYCHGEFQNVRKRVCRYFLNGACVKGKFCKFSHPQDMNFIPDVPFCRNGFRCKYLAQGVCSFFHKGVGVQMPKFQSEPEKNQESNQFHNQHQQNRWCKYQGDCFQLPECPFMHAEEDFPELTKSNQPPIQKSAQGWWEEY